MSLNLLFLFWSCVLSSPRMRGDGSNRAKSAHGEGCHRRRVARRGSHCNTIETAIARMTVSNETGHTCCRPGHGVQMEVSLPGFRTLCTGLLLQGQQRR